MEYIKGPKSIVTNMHEDEERKDVIDMLKKL
jgi:hypothetical protein